MRRSIRTIRALAAVVALLVPATGQAGGAPELTVHALAETNWILNATIGRADLNGQNVNQNFITGASSPRGVAVDSGHIYWPNGDINGTIGRADLDGQNVNQSFITGAVTPEGVAVDPN
jgi:virginiamycin B lyase